MDPVYRLVTRLRKSHGAHTFLGRSSSLLQSESDACSESESLIDMTSTPMRELDCIAARGRLRWGLAVAGWGDSLWRLTGGPSFETDGARFADVDPARALSGALFGAVV